MVSELKSHLLTTLTYLFSMRWFGFWVLHLWVEDARTGERSKFDSCPDEVTFYRLTSVTGEHKICVIVVIVLDQTISLKFRIHKIHPIYPRSSLTGFTQITLTPPQTNQNTQTTLTTSQLAFQNMLST